MTPTPQIERRLRNQLRCAVDPSERTVAAFRLAALLRNRGEVAAARKLLQDATAVPDGPLAAEAWLRLGELFDETGHPRRGAFAYRRAAELADPEHSPGVLIDVAAHAERQGGSRRPTELYRRLIEACPQPRLRAVAAFRLALIQRRSRQVGQAVASLRLALQHSEPALEPHVQLHLAEALIEAGKDDGVGGVRSEAEALLRKAIEADHHDLSPRAALVLAGLLAEAAEFSEAHRLCEMVIECEHPDFQAEAEAAQSRFMHMELEGVQGTRCSYAMWLPFYSDIGKEPPQRDPDEDLDAGEFVESSVDHELYDLLVPEFELPESEPADWESREIHTVDLEQFLLARKERLAVLKSARVNFGICRVEQSDLAPWADFVDDVHRARCDRTIYFIAKRKQFELQPTCLARSPSTSGAVPIGEPVDVRRRLLRALLYRAVRDGKFGGRELEELILELRRINDEDGDRHSRWEAPPPFFDISTRLVERICTKKESQRGQLLAVASASIVASQRQAELTICGRVNDR